MFKDFKKCIKLIKYDNSSILPSILLLMVFLAAGTYLLLITKMLDMGCALIMLAPSMLAYYFISFSHTECIAASPKKKIFETYLPNILMIFGSLLAYVTLTIIISLRANEASSIYSIYYANDFFDIYFAAIFTMFAIIILLPLVYRYSLGGIAIIAVIFAAFKVIFVIVSQAFYVVFSNIEYSFREMLQISKTKYTLYLIVGFIIVLLAILLNFKANILVKLLKCFGINLFSKYSKRRSVTKSKMKWIVAISAVAIMAIIGIYTYMDMQTTDGMYKYKNLKSQYKKLMVDCDETIEVYGFKVTLEKCYFDDVTYDGCCMLTFEAPEEVDLTGHMGNTTNDNGFWISMPNYKYYDIDNEYAGDLTSTLDTILVTPNHNGIIETEYNVNPINPNVATVYMYMNLEPNYDTPVCLQFESEDTYLDWSEEYIQVHYNDEEKIYPEYDYQTIELEDTFIGQTFEKDGHIISVSPTSLITTDDVDITELSLLFEDDKRVDIQSEVLADGVEKFVTDAYTKYIFFETIDIAELVDIDVKFSDKTENDDIIIISNENSYLKKSMSYEFHEEMYKELYVTMNFEWTQMPKYRETDYIEINWRELSWYPDYTYKITQKVYEKPTSGNGEGRLIETELEEFDYDDYTLNSTGIPIKSGTYSFHFWSNGLSISPKIYEDTKDYTYSNQTITVELVFLYDEDYTFSHYFSTPVPIISCEYYHTTKDVDGKASTDEIMNSYYSGMIGRKYNYIFNE